MITRLFFSLLLCFSASAYAQPYVGRKHTRHRFAQLNIGADYRQLSQDKREARAVIGGTHFWGHADFFIAIPVASFGKDGFYTATETGVRVYPWSIESKKLRPCAGFSFMPTVYQQGEGVFLVRNRYPVLGGLTYAHKNHLFDVGLTYNYNNRYNYYTSPTTEVAVKGPQAFIGVGYKYMIETTLSAEKEWESGRTKVLTDTLGKGNQLNGLTIAVGPSSAFFTGNSSYNDGIPYIDDHKAVGIYPDLAVGYYFHKPDIQVSLSYRHYKDRIDAYGHSQLAKRSSVALEGYKFFADYHGFAPFIGPAIGYERLEVTDADSNGVERIGAFNGISPGITFGWDIRPNRLAGFYLRTNLRYFPLLKTEMPNGKDVSFSALEINFIQLVIFPGRMF